MAHAIVKKPHALPFNWHNDIFCPHLGTVRSTPMTAVRLKAKRSMTSSADPQLLGKCIGYDWLQTMPSSQAGLSDGQQLLGTKINGLTSQEIEPGVAKCTV